MTEMPTIYKTDEIPMLRRQAERRVPRHACVRIQPTVVCLTDAGEPGLRLWFAASTRKRRVVRKFIKDILYGVTIQPYSDRVSHTVLAAELLRVTPPNLKPGGFALRFILRGFLTDQEDKFCELAELVVGIDTSDFEVLTQRGPGVWESEGPLKNSPVSIDSLLQLLSVVDAVGLASGTIDDGFQFLELTQLYANGQLHQCGRPPPANRLRSVAC